jgi:adenylate kinase
MRLVILGPPGSGKGVQSKTIAERFGIPQISTGDILRQAVKAGAELGEKARSYMEKGLLVPDDVMAELVMNRLSQEDCHQGFILDGFPRTIIQAELLDALLQKQNMVLDVVLELKVRDESVVQRISNRRLCSECGADYNLLTKPPQHHGHCDRCNGELYQREDDREETILHRLKVYHRQTAPLENFYSERGQLISVDAEKSIAEVSDTILEALSSLSEVNPTQNRDATG